MSNGRRVFVGLAVACLILIAGAAWAQESPWEKTTAAGVAAFKEGRLIEAEKIFKDALDQAEKFGSQDPRLATALTNLAMAKKFLRKFVDAEPLLKKALKIREKALGSDHLDTAKSLMTLGDLYFDEVDALQRGGMRLSTEGPAYTPRRDDIPGETGGSERGEELRRAYIQGRYNEAEPLFKRALAIREKANGPEHPDTIDTLSTLGDLYFSWKRWGEAESAYRRLLPVQEKVKGAESAEVAICVGKIAACLRERGKNADAQPLFQRAVSIMDKTPQNPEFARILMDYAALLRKTNQKAEADKMEERARAMRAKMGRGRP